MLKFHGTMPRLQDILCEKLTFRPEDGAVLIERVHTLGTVNVLRFPWQYLCSICMCLESRLRFWPDMTK